MIGPTLAELFDKSSDVAEIIKWLEIYEHVEATIDCCGDILPLSLKE